MGVIIPQVVTEDRASGAQVIDGSLRFDSSKSNYLSRTPSSAGNRQTWTYSAWVKRASMPSGREALLAAYGADNNTSVLEVGFQNSSFYYTVYDTAGTSTEVFKDPSAWQNVVIRYDGSNIKFYSNGSEVYSIARTGDLAVNGVWAHRIGSSPFNNSRFFDGYLADVHFIDGQALTPDSFGFTDSLTNTWRPKKFEPIATPNNGTVWSNTTSASGFGDYDGVTAVFDGNLSTRGGDNNTHDATYDTLFSGASISVNSSIRLYWNGVGSGQRYIRINDTTEIAGGSGGVNGWESYSYSGSLSKLEVKSANTGSYGLGAVEVDGVVLIDGDTSNIGLNGFHLPFDGNSPIGQDKSGRGNNFTPRNFGGSVALDKATGAKPILNTTPGGTQAVPGVFGSKENKFYTVTTANGSVYQFDITSGDNPSLSFIRGATYKFDYSSHAVHPLKFSSTNPDSETTAYTTGTSIASNVISFTVPHDAPPTLYYYCTAHASAMNGAISVTTDETKADKYASSCILAMPLVGVKNDVSNSVNSGSTAKAVTKNGDAYASKSESNFYGGSFFFDGTGDRLTLDIGAGGLGSGDFTIEFWSNSDTTSGSRGQFQISPTSGGLQGASTSIAVYQGSNAGFYQMYVNNNSSANSIAPTDSNKWNHFAVVRSGSTQKMYVNGIESVSGSSSIDYTTARYLCIGGYYSTSYLWDGCIQDFRIYKGVAKYTSDFIPASTSPNVLPDTPSGIAAKSKLTKITDGSVAFGSTGYMTTTSSDYNPGTGDFAIEGYFRFPDNSGTRRAFINDTGPFGSNSMVIRQYNTGFNFYCGGQSLDDSGSGTNMAQWNHAMITRSGSTVRYFVNGELRGTDTTSTNIYAEPTNRLTIGGFYDSGSGSEYMDGQASNLRLTVGSIPTEYQTSSTTVGTKIFTPSSEPLTLTSQGATSSDVKLLCCQSPTSATAAAVSSASLSTNNTVTTTSFNPFISDINAVRGQETGYCTLNPLYGDLTLSNGNLDATAPGQWDGSAGTIGMSSGKWWWEIHNVVGNELVVGIIRDQIPNITWNTTYGYGSETGVKYLATGGVSYGDAWTTGDIINVQFDRDNGTLTFYKNGISQGVAATGLTDGLYLPSVVINGSSRSCSINFGQKPFNFPPPDGFQTLNFAAIRPETVIARPDQFAGATLYTGNGGTKSIDVGHKPDFVWIKARDGSARSHHLFDSVRGVQKILQTDGTAGESSPNANSLTSFNSNGFTTGSKSGMNDNTVNYVSWTWKAGGNKNTFNIDDVGYENASDVNMSVGALNNNAINRDQLWSGLFTLASGSFDQPISNAFDGFIASQNTARTGGNYVVITMTLSTPVTVSSEIKVFGETGYDSTCTVTVGGVTHTSSNDVHTFNVSGSLTQMTLRGNIPTGRTYMEGMEIDGKILVDSNVSINVPSLATTNCSVGTKQGFSIIKYNGTGTSTSSLSTVAHGLSQAPTFMIVKSTSDTSDWYVYHTSIGPTKRINLNSAGTASTVNNLWGNGSAPTANVINLNQGWYASNYSNYTHIIYAWHDVPGFSKFGKWVNNNNNNGAFVELGFKPAVILFTDTDGGESWYFVDNQRHPSNLAAPSNSGPDSIRTLKPNSSVNEDSADNAHPNATIDFLSNGFKIRSTNVGAGEISYGTRTYVYAAWAETPSINLFGASANAR